MPRPRHESLLRFLVLASALALLGASDLAAPQAPTLAMLVGELAETLAAAPTSLPNVDAPGESALFTDAADGQLDEHSLLDAAMIASGTADATSRLHHHRPLDVCAAELCSSLCNTKSDQRRAEAVLAFLHRHILRGSYRAECTNLSDTLEHGDYNCLSSAILYIALAERCGLRAVGAEAPAHVVARVWINGLPVDVETTCRDWQQATASQPDQAPRRELSPAGLVAMVYYNRGLDLLAQRDFAGAAALNLRSLRLDSASHIAHGNLLATLNNWALDAHQRGDRDQALSILARGLQIAPSYSTFRHNAVAISQR